jgi:putative membrane protein insertion efficiency factor
MVAESARGPEPSAGQAPEPHEHDGPCAHDELPVTTTARPLITLVRWYQRAREGQPSPCRYVPSCSTYAVEALEQHGAVRGSWLAVRRLSRCHPWGSQGYDPVPPRSTWNTTADHPDDAADHPDDAAADVVTADSPGPDQKVP